jgi:hypothetical protein
MQEMSKKERKQGYYSKLNQGYQNQIFSSVENKLDTGGVREERFQGLVVYHQGASIR